MKKRLVCSLIFCLSMAKELVQAQPDSTERRPGIYLPQAPHRYHRRQTRALQRCTKGRCGQCAVSYRHWHSAHLAANSHQRRRPVYGMRPVAPRPPVQKRFGNGPNNLLLVQGRSKRGVCLGQRVGHSHYADLSDAAGLAFGHRAQFFPAHGRYSRYRCVSGAVTAIVGRALLTRRKLVRAGWEPSPTHNPLLTDCALPPKPAG